MFWFQFELDVSYRSNKKLNGRDRLVSNAYLSAPVVYAGCYRSNHDSKKRFSYRFATRAINSFGHFGVVQCMPSNADMLPVPSN